MSEKSLVAEALKKYGNSRESLIPILQHVHQKKHFISKEVMQELAEALDISSAEVYGTASFYSFLDLKERGENIIRICKSISCDLKEKKEIVAAIESKLNIKLGDTTADKKFTFLETNCLGWCHKAPAMLINDKAYTELTPEKAVSAINEYL